MWQPDHNILQDGRVPEEDDSEEEFEFSEDRNFGKGR